MNNQQVCNYVRDLDASKTKYLADIWVDNGYGQSCGGYLSAYEYNGVEPKTPSQKDHFLGYYKKNQNLSITYHYLRCPQLLLFVAEIAGVPKNCLVTAMDYLAEYESKSNIAKTKDKNGNYMWGKPEFRVFKSMLHISDVVKIIKRAENWDEVLRDTKIFKQS